MVSNAPILLIVDDVELNRAILNEVFYRQYRVLEAENGKQAVEYLKQYGADIAMVLLDNVMPEMDGFEVLEIMNRRGWITQIPVIMISSENSEQTVLQGYQLGVSDFVGRPFSSNIVRRRVDNIIELYRHKSHLENLVEQQTVKLRQANLFMIDTLGTVVEFRDGDSGEHVRRIRNVTACLLGELVQRYPEYGLTPHRADEIASAAALHDIGKIAIPDSILSKPAKLTPEEFEIMKTHTVKACEILQKIDHIYEREYFRDCYNICRHHHERWDGRGYPDKLKGDEIPVSAQVVSLADVYDALTSARVYKPAYSHAEALRMILEGECGVFNPKLISCLLAVADSLPALANLPPEALPEPLASRGGERARVLGQLSDRTLRLLELEREKYQTLAQLSGEIIFDYDPDTGMATFSEKGFEQFGEEICKKRLKDWIAETHQLEDEGRSLLLDMFRRMSPQAPVSSVQLRVRNCAGEQEWFEVVSHTFWSSEDSPQCIGCVGKITNINDRKLEASRLQDQANRDPLTGLYNARAARRLVTAAIARRPKCAAMMFIDVDNFKQVNDTRGHLYGDRILQYVAQLLQRRARSTDIVGRVGGDEFIVYLDGVRSPEDAAMIAGELCRLLREGYPDQEERCPLSGSVGIACYPADASTYSTLIECADQALYAAKRGGKGSFTFYDRQRTGEGPALGTHSVFSEIDDPANR